MSSATELQHFERKFQDDGGNSGGISLLYRLKRDRSFRVIVRAEGLFIRHEEGELNRVALTHEEARELFGMYDDWQRLNYQHSR